MFVADNQCGSFDLGPSSRYKIVCTVFFVLDALSCSTWPPLSCSIWPPDWPSWPYVSLTDWLLLRAAQPGVVASVSFVPLPIRFAYLLVTLEPLELFLFVLVSFGWLAFRRVFLLCFSPFTAFSTSLPAPHSFLPHCLILGCFRLCRSWVMPE